MFSRRKEVMSRFRRVYRPLSDEELKLRDAIAAAAAVLERLYEGIDPGSSRYHELAVEALELSVMWAVKGLTE